MLLVEKKCFYLKNIVILARLIIKDQKINIYNLSKKPHYEY